jgi:hypothetical protein
MTHLIDADALPWQVLWAWRAGEEVCAVTVDDIDNMPEVCGAECGAGRAVRPALPLSQRRTGSVRGGGP